MSRLRRQALFFFLAPLGVVVTALLTAGVTGRIAAVVRGDFGPVDLLWMGPVLVAALIPPLWGYSYATRLALALSDAALAIRRIGEGKEPGAWVEMAAEVPELFASVDETALRFRERLHSLLEEKGKLDAILTHMSEGVVLVDRRRRVISINPAAEQIFGVVRSEALGRDHLSLTNDFQLEERLGAVLQSGRDDRLELSRARPIEQVLECRLVPIAGDEGVSGGGGGGGGVSGVSGVSGVVMVFYDITRFRRLERMRTEFVANVSHELRTPLTAIRGFAETLLEGAGDDPEARNRFLGIMKGETERLTALIEDLLDLSRIESGRIRFSRQAVDLAALIRDVAGRLEHRGTRSGVTVRVELPESLPSVVGDAARLDQVLVNLVDNGIKYTPAGGTVTVSARVQGGEVVVRVSDTGVGIARADLDRVFERFYRVDKGRSRASGGTGLGLSIVKHIVETHRGRVWAESEPGAGATFAFTLPTAPTS